MKIYLQTEVGVFSKINEDEKKHTDELLLAVHNLLNEASLDISKIDVIAVLVGPGSFTGVRVAISICKGLAVGTGAKVVQLSNFDVFSFERKEKAFYVLEGFSDFVYVRKFDGETIVDACLSVDDLIEQINENKNYQIYASSEKVQNLLKKHEKQSVLCKNYTLSCVNLKITNKEFVLIEKIEPIYLRASQAEIERNKRLGVNKWLELKQWQIKMFWLFLNLKKNLLVQQTKKQF